MQEWLKVLVFASVSFVYILVIAKLLGKKQIAQLSFVDYIIGISIGSIAAEMASSTDKPVYLHIIAMTVFFLLDLVLAFIGRKSAMLKRLLNGKPQILINDGKLLYSNLKKSRMTVDELTGMARALGFFDINDIAYAVLETSGDLSVLPKSHAKPTTAKDMGVMPQKPSLPEYLVVDGKVSKDALANLEKDNQWLYDGLKVENKKDLENILIAIYDQTRGNFKVQYKEEVNL